jgi:hypothetical protein
MSDQWEPEDLVLLSSLTRILHDDPPPRRVHEDARAAFAWRDLAAQIALLEFDSAVDDEGLARVRAGSGIRRLNFHHRTIRLAVEVHRVEGRVVGRVEPAAQMSVEVRHLQGAIPAVVDDLGFFTCDGVPRGAISIRCRPAGPDSVIDTEWVTI